ncbi:MAG: hypothetical protein E6R03_11725 [Hyphomicrobiaceae bacterium]|nr:MAG: hypothetical protein E6R03_11725 [Hyphomicrobiaceae bacterium]
MTNRRNNWYNLHSTRGYPLDDAATGTSDDGGRLPFDILTDVHLRFPGELGHHVFLGGLTVTERLVTAIFLAADEIDNPQRVTPIASVSLLKPVNEGVNIAVRALYPQVGGFIVFGDTTENYVGRFSTPRQGLLAPRTARPYKSLPVTSLRRLTNAVGLTGLVGLQGQNDVAITTEVINTQNGPELALVFQLAQGAASENVLAKYIGPCGARPESDNCGAPAIEAINGAIPDCNGNIDIKFCHLTTAPLTDCNGSASAGVHGVVLDLNVGFNEVCAQNLRPGRFSGRDLCQPSSSASLSSLSLSSLSLSSLSSLSSSSSAGSIAPVPSPLPYLQTFDGGLGQLDDFIPKDGIWTTGEADSPLEPDSAAGLPLLMVLSSGSLSSAALPPDVSEFNAPPNISYFANDISRRNVSICTLPWDNGVGKVISTDVWFATNPDGNGGIVLNWQRVEPGNVTAFEQYFYASLDRRENALRLQFFNGNSWQELGRTTLAAPISKYSWYRLKATTQQVSPVAVAITVQASGVSNPAWPSVSLTASTNQFLPGDGLPGLGTVRSDAGFSYFGVRDA